VGVGWEERGTWKDINTCTTNRHAQKTRQSKTSTKTVADKRQARRFMPQGLSVFPLQSKTKKNKKNKTGERRYNKHLCDGSYILVYSKPSSVQTMTFW
jgi:hypothetical protein